jgi:hypothetical protein
MNSFLQELKSDRRLCILRLLKDCGGTANDGVLHNSLEHLGHRRLPRSTIREDINFLIGKGLISEEWFQDVQVCTITLRGVDVAEGRIIVEGVKAPRIGK